MSSYYEPDGPEERTAFYEESFERDIERIEADENDGYHRNEFGEVIPHALTVYPVDAAVIVDKITNAVKL
ncbi:MAG: hypothetical protein RB191_12815 [Terriglobia bacterium]|nr:hypothetical protein [Terriglobia bacterium]